MPSGRDYQLPVGDRDTEDRRGDRPVRDFTPAAEALNEGFSARIQRLAAALKTCSECGESFIHTPVRNIDAPFADSRTWCSTGCLDKSTGARPE